MENSSAAIRAVGLTKSYGGFDALKDVSLEVVRGEFLTLLGPSGSGKTTLLNIISGFVTPTEGALFFGTRDVTLEPPHKRNLGFVLQSYALFPHMNVGENVACALKARKVPRQEIATRVARALDLVRLSHFQNRRVDQLSGGQKQRVALARAIVFEPSIILMDEPLSALDKQLREHMQLELINLHRTLSATIVYVTHDQREALTMSDRVAVMNAGRVVQVGTPTAVYDRPCDRFVAEFIGETTLIPVQRDGADAVLLAGQRLQSVAPLPDLANLALVTRAERLILTIDIGPMQRNCVAGQVREVVFQGESRLIIVGLSDGTMVPVRQLNQRTQVAFVAGMPAILHVPPEDVVVIATPSA